MKTTTIYQDFGHNIELAYVNGRLRSATRIKGGKDEHYASLVCQLKMNESDVDPVLFFDIANRPDIMLGRDYESYRKAFKTLVLLLLGALLGSLLTSLNS
jgi:hypothetical protein